MKVLPKLVVFDWDGTLMDSTPTIVRAIQLACHDLGWVPPDNTAASWVIGLELQQALQFLMPDLSADQLAVFIERYRFHYLQYDPDLSLFPGVLELLNNLQQAGIEMAVATGKSRLGLDRALLQTGLKAFFRITRCADETFSKPNPAMLFEILDYCGVEPADALMIGDTSHDLQMAMNANMAAIGVSYGAHEHAQLAALNPLAVVQGVAELSDWFNRFLSVK